MVLENKNILITGASRGLGKELAKLLGNARANLILTARNKDELISVRDEIEKQSGKTALIIPCDVSDENGISKLTNIISTCYDCIDVLVNNAGFGIHRASELIENDEMKKLFEVNFFGPYFLIKSLLPLLKKSDSGYILNIGSLTSKAAFPENSVYAATKSALNCFTFGLDLELKKYRIKAGIIYPGLMDTLFHESQNKKSSLNPSFLFMKPRKVAGHCLNMIKKRKRKFNTSKITLALMKTKQLTF